MLLWLYWVCHLLSDQLYFLGRWGRGMALQPASQFVELILYFLFDILFDFAELHVLLLLKVLHQSQLQRLQSLLQFRCIILQSVSLSFTLLHFQLQNDRFEHVLCSSGLSLVRRLSRLQLTQLFDLLFSLQLGILHYLVRIQSLKQSRLPHLSNIPLQLLQVYGPSFFSLCPLLILELSVFGNWGFQFSQSAHELKRIRTSNWQLALIVDWLLRPCLRSRNLKSLEWAIPTGFRIFTSQQKHIALHLVFCQWIINLLKDIVDSDFQRHHLKLILHFLAKIVLLYFFN